MKKLHQRFVKTQAGATMVEYALIVALIALAVIVTVTAVGLQLDEKFQEICTALNDGEACDLGGE